MRLRLLFLFLVLESPIISQPPPENAIESLIAFLPTLLSYIKEKMPQFYNEHSAQFTDIEKKVDIYKSLSEVIGKEVISEQISNQLRSIIPQDDIKDLEAFITGLIPYLNLPSAEKEPKEQPQVNKTEDNQGKGDEVKEEIEKVEAIKQHTEFNRNNLTMLMSVCVVVEVILLVFLGIYIVTKRRITKKEIEFVINSRSQSIISGESQMQFQLENRAGTASTF